MLSGSRNPQGQTAAAADAFLEGAASAGAETQSIFLPQQELHRCRQCDDQGWGICRTQAQCIIEDDLHNLVNIIRTNDAVVFANPVYFSDLSESLRAFLDRLRRICIHGAKEDRIEGKPAVGICVAGGGGGGAPQCCASLDGYLRICGFDVADLVPVRRQNLETKCAALRILGERFAKSGGRFNA
jgi:multimeric flavodoxin WrbA